MADVKGTWLVAGTAVLAATAVTETLAHGGDRTTGPIDVALALAVVAPLTLVRAWPARAAALSGLAVLAGLLTALPATVTGVAVLTGLYAVAGRRCPTRTVAVLVLPFVGYLPLAVDQPGGRTFALFLLAATALAAAGGAARRLREEGRGRRATEQSAAASLLEYAARGERARIARELHDVVAHHITMIALQADAARLATPGLPAEGARRLVAIGDTARTALTEMRRLLGVLREDVDAASSRQPQPGLRQLNALLDEVRDAASGSGVRLIVSGPVRALDPGIELTAYRIVQEALTNARRHAPGAAVDVELRYRADEIMLRVQDNGPGPVPAPDGHGHGLAGMRERAAAVGGRVSAGPAAGTGFAVEAVLPIRTDTDPPAGPPQPAPSGPAAQPDAAAACPPAAPGAATARPPAVPGAVAVAARGAAG
jgi:signal transduction histidine kinase